MVRKSPLRAVESGESAPVRKKMSVTAAADAGDRRDLLVAMRERVATAVEDPNTAARDLAALTRRLMEIAKDIEAIDVKDAEEAEDASSTADGEWEAI